MQIEINQDYLISNDNDNYIIYDIKEGSIVEKLQEKSAYTQRFINEKEVILGIFEGKLKKYNIKEKKITLEKNLKAMINFMKSENNIINPPFLIDSVCRRS